MDSMDTKELETVPVVNEEKEPASALFEVKL
jgi:hypothetical protein